MIDVVVEQVYDLAILFVFRTKHFTSRFKKARQGIIALTKTTMQVTIFVLCLSVVVLFNVNVARRENGRRIDNDTTENGKERKIEQRVEVYGSSKVHASNRRYFWINGVELNTTKWNSSLINFVDERRIVKRNSAPCYHKKTATKARNYTGKYETISWLANFRFHVSKVTTRQPLVTNQTTSRPSLKCSRKKSCERRCTNTTEWRTGNKFVCFCDPDCYEVFNDCCSDYVKFCGVQNPKSNPKKKLAWNCVPLGNVQSNFISNANTNISHGVWMVTQCEPGWPDDYIRQYCQDPKITTVSPDINRVVPILNKENVTFRNVYCAKCNHADDTYDPWTFDIATEVLPPAYFNLTEQIRFYLAHKAEIRLVTPKDHQPRRYCVKKVVETCPEKKKGKKVIKKEQSCRNGEVEVISIYSRKHYINKDCARCNNEKSFSCFPQFNLGENAWLGNSFFLVLNFQHSKNVQPKLREAKCDDGLVFDEVLQVCTINWLRPLPEAGPERYYVISWLQAIPQKRMSLSKPVVQRSFIGYFQFLHENFNVSDIETIKDFFLVRSTVTLTPKQSLQLRTKCDKHCLRESKIINFIHFKTSWNMKIENGTFTVFKTTSRPLKCLGRKVYSSDQYSSLENGKIFINLTNTTYKKTQYFTDMTASGSTVLGNITVCAKYVPTSCNSPWTVRSPGQFEILENLSLYDNTSSTVHHYGQYEVLGNGSVQICISKYEAHVERGMTTEHDGALGGITIVCFLLSILSLIVLLTTYIIFPELRTLPGKNLMNLATSLLMFAISWLISSFTSPEQNAKYCNILIAIQHYFLVASFASMSVISFHTYRTFARKLPAQRFSENRERKVFKTYLTFTWVLPAIFAAVCFLLDLKNVMNLDYGDSTVCWFRERDAFVYFIYIPIALSLSFNIVTFLITASYLRKHNQNMAARESGAKQRSNLAIYVKLSSLMGFTWLFGLLNVVVGPTKLFEYLFVILTCLQGVCITVAFVLKKKTVRMYKEMLSSGLKSKARYQNQLT